MAGAKEALFGTGCVKQEFQARFRVRLGLKCAGLFGPKNLSHNSKKTLYRKKIDEKNILDSYNNIDNICFDLGAFVFSTRLNFYVEHSRN
jgi:hypothetical protein